ncbi:MAG: insulinase family protein [Burkholderiales bacterium]|nr:MAG: insulinase family protein [Burkholderiales bacterium]TAG83213.1 MAG: insulinase family protein [Betaproteobacteria bacterium]
MKNYIKHTLLAPVFVAFTASTLAFAQPNATPTTAAKPTLASAAQAWDRGPSVAGLTEYTLRANGLRVLLFPDASTPKTTVNITYLVGSRHEGYGETGMAHLLEHMLFKASGKYPNLWKEMNDRGFINNGTTWTDRTNYFETFNATDDNLRWALEMEADRMVNSKILREELDTEMTVVRNEFERGENNPQWALSERVRSAQFNWHNYGNSTIGNRSDIENVGIENLRAFYRNYYQPDNAVLLVAGKFDTDKTLAWIEQFFGAIPKPTRQLQKLWTVEPTQDGEREVTVRRVGDSQYLFASYRAPSALHPDHAALQVLSRLMTTEPAGRLYKAMVESKLAVAVEGDHDSMFDPAATGFWATLNKNQLLDRARDAFLRVIEVEAAKPFSAAELTRVKLQFEKENEQVLANSGRFAVALSEAIALGDWRTFFLQRDRLQTVSLADVERVARTYFKPQNRTLGRFIPTAKPDRSEMPVTPTITALMKDFKGGDALGEGEQFEPTPANIEKRVERLTLANGLRVNLLPKKTRGNTVNIALTIGFGDEASRTGKSAIETLASATMMRGAKGLDRQAIRDRMDQLRASGSIGLSGGNFQTKRDFVPDLLALVSNVYATASFPASEIELVKKEIITSIEESSKDPESVAFNAIERHFAPFAKNNVRYVETPAERIASLRAVTREQVLSYVSQMRGLSAAELSIVGDFDAPAVKSALQKNFASMKLQKPFRRIVTEHQNIAKKSERLQTPDKENATFVARVAFPLQDKATDYPSLLLADFIVGGSAGARLFTRVREKEGLSYDVFSYATVPTYSSNASWTFGFIANPQNAAKAEASLRDELKRLTNGELTEAEFEAQKKSFLDQRLVRRTSDAALASQLTLLTDTERTFAFVDSVESKIRSLKKADFDATVKKFIDVDALSSVVAGDFSKVK